MTGEKKGKCGLLPVAVIALVSIIAIAVIGFFLAQVDWGVNDITPKPVPRAAVVKPAGADGH